MTSNGILGRPPGEFFSTDTLSLDLETTGRYGNPDPFRDDVLLISLNNGKESIVLQPGGWLGNLWEWMRDSGHTTIIHNVGFDLQFLWSLGFSGYPDSVWDTLLIERILTNGKFLPCDLSSTAWRNCSVLLDKSIRDSFISQIGRKFTPEQVEYSKKDVDFLQRIADRQRGRLGDTGQLKTGNLENALIPIISDMEYTGVLFDLGVWDRIIKEETVLAEDNQQWAWNLLPSTPFTMDLLNPNTLRGVNLNSPGAVLEALHKIGIDVPNTREKTLKEYLVKHPDKYVLSYILDYRKHRKRIGFDYPKYINAVTGRIHTSYNPLGARTGRFSSSNPNLQNVLRDPLWRSCFTADSGCVLITADYSQQEMRGLAQVTGDKNLIEVCKSEDIHARNAELIFGKVTRELRQIAKNCGFAMGYGASAETVATTAGISIAEATRVVDYTREHFSDVEKWAKEQRAFVLENGWVATPGGRRRWFVIPDDQREWGPWVNAARNMPIQGMGADMIKTAIVFVTERFIQDGINANVLMTIHDEIVVQCDEKDAGGVQKVVEQEMVRAGEEYITCVPVSVDSVIAKTWTKV